MLMYRKPRVSLTDLRSSCRSQTMHRGPQDAGGATRTPADVLPTPDLEANRADPRSFCLLPSA